MWRCFWETVALSKLALLLVLLAAVGSENVMLAELVMSLLC